MTENIRLDGRVALVTGAGRGLGRAHALVLAAHGAKVVVNDNGAGLFGDGTDASVAQAVVDEIIAAGGTAIASAVPIGRQEDARQIVGDAVAAFGRLDIVVNNAGYLLRRPFLDHTPEMLAGLLAVHVTGPFFLAQEAFKVMQAQNYGRFIFTTSVGGIRGNPFVAGYGTAKGGVIGLANVVALAGVPYNIKANIILPYAATRMADAMETKSSDEGLVRHHDILAKALDPRHVSATVVYLASEECTLNHTILTAGGSRVAVTATVIGEGWSGPQDALQTAEAVRDHLPEIMDLGRAVYHQSSDEEGGAFLRPVIEAAMGAKAG